MELVLEAANGVPEGCVLSLKVGDTKRQAPTSRLGQPFRFASSLGNTVSLKAEILTPSVEPKTVDVKPNTDRFVVDFGSGVSVTLKHRPIDELQQRPVDIGEVAQARGLTTDKLEMAQTAAKYLEQHDLVRTFQDLLHGLLVSKPQDPHAYVQEKLSNQKKMVPIAPAAGESVTAGAPEAETGRASFSSSRGGSKDKNGDQGSNNGKRSSTGNGKPRRASVREQMRKGSITQDSKRGSVQSNGKVDTLLFALQSTHENLDVVLPFLPEELRTMLVSEDLAKECKTHFDSLDTRQQGKLSPEDIVPLLVTLTTARSQGISRDHCKRFVQMFDFDEDGYVNSEEFTILLQFVIITAYMESPEGKATLETAKLEESNFKDFIKMIEDDMEKLWCIIPFLPQWMEEHLCSDDFQRACHANFLALDKDGSGQLEPMELVPVIQELFEAHPLSIDFEKCKKFVKLFDQHNNGVIMQDEFVEFAQYLAVMNFLTSKEGQIIAQQANEFSKSDKLSKSIDDLKKAPSTLMQVLNTVPKMLKDDLLGAAFEKTCNDAFDAIDKSAVGRLPSDTLIPVVVKLSEAHAFFFDFQTCRSFLAYFDKELQTGHLEKKRFVEFARYSITLAYLCYSRDHQDMLVQDILVGREKIGAVLETLRANVSKIGDIIPSLPDDFKRELLSSEFEAQCIDDFVVLDKDRSGVLEPSELLPVVLTLSEAHRFAMTEEHAREFVDIFDFQRNGVITQPEYINFARFLLIMAYLETEEGRFIQQDYLIQQEATHIEEWLSMVEKDRNSIHKIVSLLPKHVFEHLTSDNFVQLCHDRFVELDRDKTGVLRPHELVPLVVDLTGSYAGAVTEAHGMRFTKIFDVHGDGVLRHDEFLDFLRFLTIMGYLQSDEGQIVSKEAVKIMSDSKKIEDLLAELAKDRRHIQKVLPYLPSWLHDEVISDHFTINCMATFKELDKDGNGTLEPEELYPLVLTLAQTHDLALDISQCKRFTAIFDDAGDGVIRKSEFVNFCRFHLIMSYLHSQDGAKALKIMKDDAPESRSPNRPEAVPSRQIQALPPPVDDSATHSPRSFPPASPRSAADTGHLVVECEFYQKKAEKLKAENETMRGRMHSLEELVRKLEQKIEDQEILLRHNEVDLVAIGKYT